MTSERMYSVPEVARFFGTSQQAVRQAITEGHLEASKVRVKGAAHAYRISAEAIRRHYDMTDAEMKSLAGEVVRYRVGFPGWAVGMPFPDHQPEHSTYDSAVTEARRVLAALPRFREENAAMGRWLLNHPEGPDRAIVYPDPIDESGIGDDPGRYRVEIIDDECRMAHRGPGDTLAG